MFIELRDNHATRVLQHDWSSDLIACILLLLVSFGVLFRVTRPFSHFMVTVCWSRRLRCRPSRVLLVVPETFPVPVWLLTVTLTHVGFFGRTDGRQAFHFMLTMVAFFMLFMMVGSYGLRTLMWRCT